jgi:hypothetical protein
MATDRRLDKTYLLQEDLIREFIPSIGKEQWQAVFASTEGTPDSFAVFSGLLPAASVPAALVHDGWDLSIGDGLPGFGQSWEAKKKITTYHRYGGFGAVRPLIIFRQFHGAWREYAEISEEFRHFHDLAEDSHRDTFLAFDASGYPIDVARVQPERVEIRLPYLLQFLAATQLHLAIFFDVRRFSLLPIDQIPGAERDLLHADQRSRYLRHVRQWELDPDLRTFSRLLGKVIIAPPPVERCRKWPYPERESEPEISFTIGVNPDGSPREFTSHPDKLSNYFGANSDAPHYLTPVYFRREVLSKYYADPDRYAVSDGYLGCLGLWGVQIDNNHPTHVVVFLGDLGRDLPHEERLHWKQFNVSPEGGISQTNFRRSFLAQWAAPEAADLTFRSEYERLDRAWGEALGWPLFLKPEAADAYLLTTIRVPVTTSQAEFDQQILALTKLLVDSLNEQALIREVGPGQKDDKGITKLERFLASRRFPQTVAVIQFLRDLQALRSAGAGHRKGARYDQILAKLGPDTQRKPELMDRLLREATVALRALRNHFGSGDPTPG